MVSLPTSLCSASAQQGGPEQEFPEEPWAKDMGDEQGWEKMQDMWVKVFSGGKHTSRAQISG